MKLSDFRPGTVTRIAVGVAALVTMLLMALDLALGLVPDAGRPALERRQLGAELLAERVTAVASRQGPDAVVRALHEARLEDRQLRSAGLRRADGALLASTGDHATRWQSASEAASAARSNLHGSLLRVPVRADGQPWGRLELVYDPLPAQDGLAALLRLQSLWPGLVFALSTVLLRLYLGRVLHQLDPSAAVPERVRTAYNALNEAVAITDAQGRLMLVNQAFQRLVAPRSVSLGRRLEDHAWVREALRFDSDRLPWRAALAEGRFIGDQRMTLAAPEDDPVADTTQSVDDASSRATGEDERVALVDCTPIRDDRERVQGCLIVFQDQTAIERTNEELERTLSDLRVANAQISEQHQEMIRLATLDPLTGCMNRRAFFEAAQGQMQRCLFDQGAAAVIMVDIDHFKSFNDRYGHATGDEVIRAVARLLQEHARDGDLVCRYGGEEFCILLPDCVETEGLRVAEGLRTTIASEAGRHIRELDLSITVSLGLAVTRTDRVSLEALIEQADQALYASKRNGRNRVTLASAQTAAEADQAVQQAQAAAQAAPRSTEPA